jgi:hypothetical protein
MAAGALLAAALGLLLAVGPAAAATFGGFGVRPATFNPNNPATRAYFIVQARPGASRAEQLVVTNNQAAPLTLHVNAVDGLTGVTSGVVYANREVASSGAGRWVTAARSLVTVPGHATIRVGFVVRIPRGALPGDHVAGIALEPVHSTKSGGNFSVTVVVRTVVGIEIEVAGPARQSIRIYSMSLAPLPGTDVPSVVVALADTGRKLCHPRLKVALTGSSGTTVASQSLDTILPGDEIAYPFRWPGSLRPGRYGLGVTATGCGPAASFVTSADYAPGAAPATSGQSVTHVPASTPLASVPSRSHWWLFLIAALAGMLLATLIVLILAARRRRRGRWTPVGADLEALGGAPGAEPGAASTGSPAPTASAVMPGAPAVEAPPALEPVAPADVAAPAVVESAPVEPAVAPAEAVAPVVEAGAAGEAAPPMVAPAQVAAPVVDAASAEEPADVAAPAVVEAAPVEPAVAAAEVAAPVVEAAPVEPPVAPAEVAAPVVEAAPVEPPAAPAAPATAAAPAAAASPATPALEHGPVAPVTAPTTRAVEAGAVGRAAAPAVPTTPELPVTAAAPVTAAQPAAPTAAAAPPSRQASGGAPVAAKQRSRGRGSSIWPYVMLGGTLAGLALRRGRRRDQ